MEAEVCISETPPGRPREHLDRWSDLFLAWTDHSRHWLLGAMALLYLAGINGQWRMDPDSALYLSLARNVAAGRGFTYHNLPCAQVYPGLPYLMAIAFRLFPGLHTDPVYLPVEHLMIFAMGMATLGLTYRLFRLHANRPVAVLVTCGVGMSRTFSRATFSLLTDLPFLLGVVAMLAGYEGLIRKNRSTRDRWIDGGLMLFGALLTIAMRPAWLALVPVTVVAIIGAGLRRNVSWKTAIAAAVVAVLAAVLFYMADPRQAAGPVRPDRYEDQVRQMLQPDHWASTLARAEANTLNIFGQTATSAMLGFKFGRAPDSPETKYWYDRVGTACNALGAAVTLGVGIALLRRRTLWGLFVITTVAMMVFIEPHERYFLQILPLLIFAWWRGLDWINRRLPLAAGNIIFALLLGLGFFPNAVQVIGLVIEQRRPSFMAHYHGGKYQPVIASAERIANTAPDTVILAPDKYARIISYLANRDVYESGTEDQLYLHWPPPSRRVYVLQASSDTTLPAWISDKGITATMPIEGGSTPAMRGMELRRVPRRQIK